MTKKICFVAWRENDVLWINGIRKRKPDEALMLWLEDKQGRSVMTESSEGKFRELQMEAK